MGLFNRKNENTNQKNYGAAIKTNLSHNKNSIILTRKDGSYIELIPIKDRAGNQKYETYMNSIGISQSIPVYNINCDELSKLEHQSLSKKILLDIDPNMLKNEYYKERIANSLLAPSRIEKIFNQYGGYTGTFNLDVNGFVMGKSIDQTVIRNIKEKIKADAEIARQNRIRDQKIRYREERAMAIRNAEETWHGQYPCH